MICKKLIKENLIHYVVFANKKKMVLVYNAQKQNVVLLFIQNVQEEHKFIWKQIIYIVLNINH